jgi:hypothetical protein
MNFIPNCFSGSCKFCNLARNEDEVKDIITELTRNIWNKIIAEPKNEKRNFNFSPEKLRKVIEETLTPPNKILTKKK